MATGVNMGQTIQNQALGAALNQLLSLEAHGWTRHLNDTRPYLSPKTYPEWAHIQQMARISRDHEQRLTALMERLGVPVVPSTYESAVAGYHYVDLATLLHKLIEEKRRQIAAYERAIPLAGGDTTTVEVLQDLLADVQGQRELLEASLARVAA